VNTKPTLRSSMWLGLSIAVLLTLASWQLLNWTVDTLAPGDPILQALLLMIGGVTNGVVAGFVSWRLTVWWYHRNRPRRTDPSSNE
jgi:hypothetical protein